MPLTIRDAESSFLEAWSVVEQWREDFLKQWLQPEMDMALITFWSQLDPAVKEQLKVRNPRAYAAVNQQVKEAIERYQNG